MDKITRENPYAEKYDLDNCDKEPIHIIQTIQSFAAIISVDLETWVVTQVSDNITQFFDLKIEQILQQPLGNILSQEVCFLLKEGQDKEDFSEINPISLNQNDLVTTDTIIHAHLTDNQLIIQVERDPNTQINLGFLNKIDTAIQAIQHATVQAELQLLNLVVKEVKTVTKYDRVMMYKFDEDYNGQVVAEAKEADLEPFLNIRYPASDIPEQARKLFLSNRTRIIADVQDELAMMTPPVHPITKKPLNVGHAAARGSSPIHLEYLRNMGVRATLNVAIVENDRLWGLISCHHYQDKMVLDYRTRNLIGFFGQILSGHLSHTRNGQYRENLLKSNILQNKLITQINENQNIIEGLILGPVTLRDFIPSIGAAIVFDEEVKSTGETPDVADIRLLVQQFKEHKDNLIVTTDISKDWPDLNTDTEKFAGFLAIRLSHVPAEYIIWFRPQILSEVVWGGNPNKAVVNKEKGIRLSPRKSFAKWKEVIKGRSKPWTDSEKDAVLLLRNDLKEIVFTRINELKQLHSDLKASYSELETFSYTISHDLRSPLRIIEGYGQILLEDYQDKLDEYGVEMIQSIIEQINEMNDFMNDILKLSRLARNKINPRQVNMQQIISPLTQLQFFKNANPNTVFEIKTDLLNVYGDPTMVKQVFQNVIDNAVKYSKQTPKPIIQISAKKDGKFIAYAIKDNGIGFEKSETPKIFEAFNRLTIDQDFEGTGIGLSIVKRIMDRHQGKIKVESSPNEGSTFTLMFPIRR